MNAKRWFIYFTIELFVLLIGISSIVVFVDPYFHYHKPIKYLFYTLSRNDQRLQNDGIIKYFDYDSIITGTSMAENFMASEFNEIFNADAVKVCFFGGSYKEINDNLNKAFDSNHDVKYVLRCLDYGKILEDKDKMRDDLGEYPTYLYDKNPFNDIKYIMNKEIIFNICLSMINSFYERKEGGITSFDIYSNWNASYVFGAKSVIDDNKKEYIKAEKDALFTEADRKIVKENIEQNVICLARMHPETTFYYFFSPYSIVYWGKLYENGDLNRQIAAEKYAIEQILKCENIKLYSFNTDWSITTNLDNYKDTLHYGEWINTEILHMIYNNVGLLTEENYEKYIDQEREFYSNYVYQFYDVGS